MLSSSGRIAGFSDVNISPTVTIVNIICFLFGLFPFRLIRFERKVLGPWCNIKSVESK